MARNKPRKWSNLKGQLPAVEEPSEWMMKVLAEKDKLAGKSMAELKDEYAALEEEQRFEDLARAERNIKFAALEKRILEELAKIKELAGTDMWRGDGHTFSPKYTPRPVVKDPAALMDWIKQRGLQELLSLPSARLKSIVVEALNTEMAAMMSPAERAALKPGDPGSGMPPPGVEVFLHETVHHTSGTKKSARRSSDDTDEDAPF